MLSSSTFSWITTINISAELVVLFWPHEKGGVSANFRKMEKRYIGCWFNSCFWQGNRALNSNVAWMLHTFTLLLRLGPSQSKIVSTRVSTRLYVDLVDRRLRVRDTAETGRHLKEQRKWYAARNILHAKDVGVIGAHSGQQAQLRDTTRKSFCIVSRPNTKHGSTQTHRRSRNSQNNGLLPTNLPRIRRILFYKPKRTAIFSNSKCDPTEEEQSSYRFVAELQQKWSHLVKIKVFFPYDNQPTHISIVAKVKFSARGTYFCFQTLKNHWPS